MPIVLISEALLLRSTVSDGRILRDRVLCGFCVRMHDLRKLVATVGEKLGLGDAVLRQVWNHTASKSDVLHRHDVGLNTAGVAGALVQIQEAMVELMGNARQGV